MGNLIQEFNRPKDRSSDRVGNSATNQYFVKQFKLSSWSMKMLGTILIVILVLMLLGVMPNWPHSRNWGYGPSGLLGLIVLILIILLLLGRLPF
jgi:hypothetical protein